MASKKTRPRQRCQKKVEEDENEKDDPESAVGMWGGYRPPISHPRGFGFFGLRRALEPEWTLNGPRTTRNDPEPLNSEGL